MSKGERFDLLLVQVKDSAVCAVVPFGKAQVGDLVTCEDGIGEVISKIEWLEKDGNVVNFVKEIISVHEAVTVYHRGYAKEVEQDGN